MKIKMTIQSWGTPVVKEEYVVPDGSWVSSKLMGAQYAYPVLKAEITNKNNIGVVMCEPVKELPEIPKELLELVNSKDKKWGKNGYEYLGKNRECQGGTEIDRIREIAGWGKLTNGSCPVQVSENIELVLRSL